MTSVWTAADLVERFGPIPLHRIRLDPAPGTATEQDVIQIHNREDRLFELVDGVLVEKTVGTFEAYLAGVLVRLLGNYVVEHDVGIVLPPDGMMRLAPELVRIPDVSFISWKRLPGRRIPREPIASLAPDLAVEVISKYNTRQEMERKLLDYFAAGVREVWYVDHAPRRQVRVFATPEQFTVVSEREALAGGEILPGFTLPLEQLFAEPGESSGS